MDKANAVLFAILVLVISSNDVDNIKPPPFAKRCKPEKILTKSCHPYYKFAKFPNSLGHESQELAIEEMKSFDQLVATGCSDRLQFLLCSIYIPVCDPISKLFIRPCRSMCVEVRDKCAGYLYRVGLAWPKSLDCNELPISFEKSQEFCMNESMDFKDDRQIKPKATEAFDLPNFIKEDKVCKHLRGVERSSVFYFNKTLSCNLKCSDDTSPVGLYSPAQKKDMELIMKLLLLVITPTCLYGLLLAIFMSKLDQSANHLEEETERRDAWWNLMDLRNEIKLQSQLGYAFGWLCLTQLLQAVPMFIRLIMGYSEIACDIQKRTILQEGLNNPACAVTFMLDTFFFNASLGWSLVFGITYLSSTAGMDQMKRNSLSIQSPIKFILYHLHRSLNGNRAANSGLVWRHVLTWAPSGIITASLLVLRSVEANELTGLCQVGLHRHHPLWLLENETNSTYSSNNFSELRHLFAFFIHLFPMMVTFLFLTALFISFKCKSKDSTLKNDAGNITTRFSKNFQTSSRIVSIKRTYIIWSTFILNMILMWLSMYEHFRWPKWMLNARPSGVFLEPYILQVMTLFSRFGFSLIILGFLLRPSCLVFIYRFVQFSRRRRRDLAEKKRRIDNAFYEAQVRGHGKGTNIGSSYQSSFLSSSNIPSQSTVLAGLCYETKEEMLPNAMSDQRQLTANESLSYPERSTSEYSIIQPGSIIYQEAKMKLECTDGRVSTNF